MHCCCQHGAFRCRCSNLVRLLHRVEWWAAAQAGAGMGLLVGLIWVVWLLLCTLQLLYVRGGVSDCSPGVLQDDRIVPYCTAIDRIPIVHTSIHVGLCLSVWLMALPWMQRCSTACWQHGVGWPVVAGPMRCAVADVPAACRVQLVI